MDAAVKFMLNGMEYGLLDGRRIEVRGIGVLSLQHQNLEEPKIQKRVKELEWMENTEFISNPARKSRAG
jgi:nucleoid DNA-binding protein